VILDATWRDPELRTHAARLASETHSALVELMCSATVDVAAERIANRRRGNSDATPQIAAALAARRGGWDTAQHINTGQDLEESAREAHNAWRRAI
jgi:predicted kinase